MQRSLRRTIPEETGLLTRRPAFCAPSWEGATVQVVPKPRGCRFPALALSGASSGRLCDS